MAESLNQLYKIKKNRQTCAASFRNDKGYIYVAITGEKYHINSFARSLSRLTGQEYSINPVYTMEERVVQESKLGNLSGCIGPNSDLFAVLQIKERRYIEVEKDKTLRIVIPRILFSYKESGNKLYSLFRRML